MTDPFRQYDDENIFAQILRADADPGYQTKFRKKPEEILYRDDNTIAFADIRKDAAVHALVIPKKSYIGFDDFIGKASDAEIAGYFRSVYATAKKLGVEKNFRLLSNNGQLAGQTIPHLHFHILGGQSLPPFKVSDIPNAPVLPDKPNEVLDYSNATAACYRGKRQPPFDYVEVAPKKDYADFGQFIEQAKDDEIAGFFRALHTASHAYGVGTGFRILSSNGKQAGQEKPHFAMQVLIGMDLGPLLPNKEPGLHV